MTLSAPELLVHLVVGRRLAPVMLPVMLPVKVPVVLVHLLLLLLGHAVREVLAGHTEIGDLGLGDGIGRRGFEGLAATCPPLGAGFTVETILRSGRVVRGAALEVSVRDAEARCGCLQGTAGQRKGWAVVWLVDAGALKEEDWATHRLHVDPAYRHRISFLFLIMLIDFSGSL